MHEHWTQNKCWFWYSVFVCASISTGGKISSHFTLKRRMRNKPETKLWIEKRWWRTAKTVPNAPSETSFLLNGKKAKNGNSKMQTVANYKAQNLSTRIIMVEYCRNTYFTWLVVHNLSFNFAWVKFAQLKLMPLVLPRLSQNIWSNPFVPLPRVSERMSPIEISIIARPQSLVRVQFIEQQCQQAKAEKDVIVRLFKFYFIF